MMKCLIYFLLFFIAGRVFACELVMGYRTNAKPPFINAAPDNSGLYKDLYSEALRRINCRLRIERFPKARVFFLMKKGEIDFYPGLSFSEQRSTFLAFLPNGLEDGYIGLTRNTEAEITSLNQVAARRLIMVVSFGSHDLNAEQYDINIRRPYDFDLSQLVDLILAGQADFHAYNLLAVKHFLKENPDKAKMLKVHEHCCDEPEDMFLAFSKSSQHIVMRINPEYHSGEPLEVSNTPDRVGTDSIGWRLFRSLEEMKRDGSFARIFRQYFGGSTDP